MSNPIICLVLESTNLKESRKKQKQKTLYDYQPLQRKFFNLNELNSNLTKISFSLNWGISIYCRFSSTYYEIRTIVNRLSECHVNRAIIIIQEKHCTKLKTPADKKKLKHLSFNLLHIGFLHKYSYIPIVFVGLTNYVTQ